MQCLSEHPGKMRDDVKSKYKLSASLFRDDLGEEASACQQKYVKAKEQQAEYVVAILCHGRRAKVPGA